MLVGEDGGRHEHRHLALALHRLERGADRDLGLAVSDVAHEEPVHGTRPFHVTFDVGGGGALVGCVLEEKR